WVTGFVAIPLLGMHHSLGLTALISVGVGVVFLAHGSLQRRHQGWLYTGVLGLFAVVLVATPTLRFADIAGEPEKEVLHCQAGVAGVVTVATDIYDRNLLTINAWPFAATRTPN